MRMRDEGERRIKQKRDRNSGKQGQNSLSQEREEGLRRNEEQGATEPDLYEGIVLDIHVREGIEACRHLQRFCAQERWIRPWLRVRDVE